jgi:hypothetical protein
MRALRNKRRRLTTETRDQNQRVHSGFRLSQTIRTSQGAHEVAAVIDVNVVEINVIEVHAPKAGDLPRELHAITGFPGLLYNGHDLLQALRGAVHVDHLQVHLVLVGHLDGQVLQEPWVVLDLRNGYPLQQMADENAADIVLAANKVSRETLLAPVFPRRSGTADVGTPLKPRQNPELRIVR